MAERKTSKAKANTKASITIKEADADVKRKAVHNDNMEKVAKATEEKGDNIPQGKPLNNKTYEYACDDCLEKVMANGDVFCASDEPLSNTGRCNCGNLTTHKAILL